MQEQKPIVMDPERTFFKGNTGLARLSLANKRRITAAKQPMANAYTTETSQRVPRNAFGLLGPVRETGAPGTFAFALSDANRAKVLPKPENALSGTVTKTRNSEEEPPRKRTKYEGGTRRRRRQTKRRSKSRRAH